MPSWLGALGAAVGGGAQGAAPALGDVSQRRDRRREFDVGQQGLQDYRQQTLAQDASQHTESLALDRDRLNYSTALDKARERRARFQADTDRIRVEHEINRSAQATREDTTQEEYRARFARAQRAMGDAAPNMSQDQLDRIARINGFTDYGQVIGVAQTAGQQVPQAGTIPNPGESGLDTVNRMRSQPGFTGFGDHYQDVLYDDEVRSALGR